MYTITLKFFIESCWVYLIKMFFLEGDGLGGIVPIKNTGIWIKKNTKEKRHVDGTYIYFNN